MKQVIYNGNIKADDAECIKEQDYGDAIDGNRKIKIEIDGETVLVDTDFLTDCAFAWVYCQC